MELCKNEWFITQRNTEIFFPHSILHETFHETSLLQATDYQLNIRNSELIPRISQLANQSIFGSSDKINKLPTFSNSFGRLAEIIKNTKF